MVSNKMYVIVDSPDKEYLETLGGSRFETNQEGDFGKLVIKILFTRPFATPVKIYFEKDENNPLKHLVFGVLNSQTFTLSKSIPNENIPNQLYHVHGHYNYDNSIPEEKALNQRILQTGKNLINQVGNFRTEWFIGSMQTYAFHSGQDGPHKPGSWAIFINNTSHALEYTLFCLMENNRPREPYLIHAVTERDPSIPGPNLKNHIENIILIGDQSVDWEKQFEYQWIADHWATN